MSLFPPLFFHVRRHSLAPAMHSELHAIAKKVDGTA